MKLYPYRRRIIAAIILLITAAVLCFAWICNRTAQTAFSPQGAAAPLIILDAGHGGADGGAVSAEGAVESDINLQITRRLALLLLFCGENVALTRTDESDLSSPEATTIKEQKASDLKNRVAAINSAENAVLISIHQNSLAGHPEVHGAQAFYNKISGSELLAAFIQQQLNQAQNQGNEKLSKAIDNSIYLMKEVNCPAVLVECGFLSNPSEARNLCTEEYQMQLALSIAAGYLQYTKEGKQ